jgi:hypothetical protein
MLIIIGGRCGWKAAWVGQAKATSLADGIGRRRKGDERKAGNAPYMGLFSIF